MRHKAKLARQRVILVAGILAFIVIAILVLVVSFSLRGSALSKLTLSSVNPLKSRHGTIELTDLPDQYCPKLAAVVTTALKSKDPTIISDTTVPIEECRFISLDNLPEFRSQPALVFVKIANALAFRLQIDSTAARYHYAPSLGDANNDNIIDATDENQVSAALFTTEPTQISANDLDQDGKVSVLDLSLTRINRRAGSERPDGQSWRGAR